MCEDCKALVAAVPQDVRDRIAEQAAGFMADAHMRARIIGQRPVSDTEAITTAAFLLAYIIQNMDVDEETRASILWGCMRTHDSGGKLGHAVLTTKKSLN